MENSHAPSPYRRFSVMVAIIQLACVLSTLFLTVYSSFLTGKDSWIVWYAIIPWVIMYISAPLSIVSAPLYAYKYRQDPLNVKVIVATAFITGLWFVFGYSINH